MQERKRCRYYEWDKESFLLPADLMLSDRSELADALRVFYCAGGYDFFCVSEPKLYASRWLMFLGELYERIVEGRYACGRKNYAVPLDEMQKAKLAERGVPAVFLRDCQIP